MSLHPARPTPNRQASTGSTASTFSTPESHLVTPAYGDFSGIGSPTYSDDGRSSPSASYFTREAASRKPLSALEQAAYTYALRVAALHSHQHPAPPTPSPLSSPVAMPPNPHRKSFSFRKSSPVSSPVTPPPVPSLPPLNNPPSDAKLPKEYLIELWGLLASEPGDAAFLEAKRKFLSGIKKGSRNERGGNLREVGVLLETRPQSEKDRDLLRRLRREVAGYILEQPISTTMPSSSGPRAGLSINTTERKPGKVDLSEMEETVGLIFGFSREILKKDIEDMQELGGMDELLVGHLKSTLAQLSALPTLTSAQRHRHADLSRQLSALLQQFPHLGNTPTPSTPFFTPSRKLEVYSALSDKAEENVTLQRRGHLLVDECVRVWSVPGEEEREKEVEGLIIAWTRCAGHSREEEKEWGRLLEEGVGDLCAGRDPQAGLAVGMEQLSTALLALLGKSAAGLLGDGAGSQGNPKAQKVNAPPVSLLPLLLSGDGIFLRQEKTLRKMEDIRDELKGSAVGEYVQSVEWLMGGIGAGMGGKEQVEGFAEVASRIEAVVVDILAKWGEGLGEIFNPAAIVLSKQLPLFFAELQMLDPGSTIGSDAVFGLYEATGRLGARWEELCPGTGHGFEIDTFFEPYVVAWLKETEASKVHEWVSRAVAMDRWVPEGDQNYSQSVVDLFDFIQQSLRVILQDLPLGQYKRALYLTDMSKTASLAVTQYASTLQALFHVDMNPPKPANMAGDLSNKLNDKIGGKAGSWLAKGQQAMKGLERKRVEGFAIPPTAMVKLSNVGAAKRSLDDLTVTIKPDDNARLTRSKTREADNSAKYPFVITVARGQNLLGKGQSKAADAFCIATDVQTSERLVKTRTVLGAEDPRWDQSFEIIITSTKAIEIAVYDRSLVGKHDLIGSTSVKLDPKAWTSISSRDVQIPLQPRGILHLRISLEGGLQHQENDIQANLARATRTLQRHENDMIGEVVERMMEFVRDQLASRSLAEMTKVKDKKKGKVYVGEAELNASLGAVYEYLNINFATFTSTLSPAIRLDLQLKLWTRILEHLISLLVPPLSDRPSFASPVPADQVEIVLKWLQLLKAFFNAREGNFEHGVKLTALQAGVYKDIMMVGQYLDLPTPALKERTSAAVKGVVARGRGLDDGTSQAESEKMAEVLLRIVRTRPEASDFLAQQVGALFQARMDRHAGLL